MDQLVIDLKSRLHITHFSEDDRLKNSLQMSEKAIARMVGFDDLSDLEFLELVLERSRYAYYDEVEYFEDSFHSQIVGLQMRGVEDETTA